MKLYMIDHRLNYFFEVSKFNRVLQRCIHHDRLFMCPVNEL